MHQVVTVGLLASRVNRGHVAEVGGGFDDTRNQGCTAHGGFHVVWTADALQPVAQ